MNRTIPGILLALGWLLLLMLGSFQLFWGVMVVIGFLGSREYCRMAFADYLYESDRVLLPLLIILPIVTALFCRQSSTVVPAGLLFGFIGLALYVLFPYQRFDAPLMVLAKGTLGLICIGFFASHLVLLRGLADGSFWLIILTAITAGSDTGAFYTGSRLGKRKLCPNISPNKTIEGAIGAVLVSLLIPFLLWFSFPHFEPWHLVLTGLIVGVGGQLGDLVISFIKRDIGIKDMGNVIQGHGGILDRVDSMIFVAPIFFHVIRWIHGIR